jgi:hypothetical protein
MATPITHLVLAREFHRQHPTIGSERDFLVGVLFPDIRHVTGLARELTHDPAPSLAKVLNAPDAFMAGLEHHALVDVTRQRFVLERHGYDLVPNSPYLTVAFKFVEDETMYERETNWSDVAELLKGALPQEHVHGLKEADILKWHDLTIEYILEAPTPATRRRFVVKGGWPPEAADEIEAVVAELKKHAVVSQIIADLYRDFDSLTK